jgi:hypothetical protein
MKTKKQDPYSFNTNIPSHNQFPTNEEREKIEKKVFTERRSQANRKLRRPVEMGIAYILQILTSPVLPMLQVKSLPFMPRIKRQHPLGKTV